MQVWAAVNEADIGRIYSGQPVRMTVDAFPNETFQGMVNKIRLNASMTQNVVTYTVEVDIDNSDGKLLPYLTANVRFEVAKREQVLLVPSSALIWKPSSESIVPATREERGARTGRDPSASSGGATRGTLWIQDGSFVKPMSVEVGASDGTSTEVSGAGVQENLNVVLGEMSRNDRSATVNPFTPQVFGQRRGQ